MKFTKMNRLLTAILSLLTFAGTQLNAAPLDIEEVSAQANWVAHLDFSNLLKTEVGKFILAEVKKDQKAQRQLAGIKAAFGVDVEGLGNLTVFGRGENEKGIAIASGGFNAKQIEGFVTLNENIRSSNYKGKTIYAENKNAFVIVDEDTIVAGTGQDYVKHGLDVLDGIQPSMKGNDILNELAKAIPYPVAVAIANLNGITAINPPKKAPEAAILKKATALGVAIGEVDGQVRIAAVLKAADEATAGHLENVMRGGASLLTLGADLDPNLAELASTVKTHVARDGSHVRVYLGVSASLVKEKLAEEMAKNKAAQAREDIDGSQE